MGKRTLIVDADVVVYQIACASEEKVPFETEDGLIVEQRQVNMCQALASVEDYLDTLREDMQADALALCLTDTGNYWRLSVLPSYKGNRKEKDRPLALARLRQHLIDEHGAYLRPGLEGDDIYGILLTHPKIIKGERIGVSIDKDMLTIPGRHADLKERKVYEVTKDEADYWHLYQTLTGDSTDNYKGCPGIGPVAAQKLLTPLMGDLPAMWKAVVDAFAKKKLGPEEALTQARVARILRHTDYNFKTKEVRLWTPPTETV